MKRVKKKHAQESSFTKDDAYARFLESIVTEIKQTQLKMASFLTPEKDTG